MLREEKTKMIELAIILLVLGVAFYAIVYGSLFFIAAVAFGYWILSIGMAPVLWVLMLVGTVVGFVIALRNAIKAGKSLK